MASLKVHNLTRLVKYFSDVSFKSASASVYRSQSTFHPRRYSTEGQPKEAVDPSKASTELPTTVEECHARILDLTTQVEKLQESVKDFDDKYRRALADGENIRRRMTKQVEDAKSFAIQSFCKDLLEVADTLSLATESVPEKDLANASAAMKALHDGVRLTQAQLVQVFSRHGLVRVHPLNEKFDPNLHEALFQQEVQGAAPGTVVTVSKVGYKLHERCVRPALVGVAKS